jgi:hypothetical protein
VAVNSCATVVTSPPLVVGTFADDYDNRYTISNSEWSQPPYGRYRVVGWHLEDQYLIAQNDSSNTDSPGRWTRIDWMPLSMPPYTWAFCYSAYDAPSADSAAATLVADRTTPRTGCNGHPFSRMRPVAAP